MGLDVPEVAVEDQPARGAGADRDVVGGAIDDRGGRLACLLLEGVPFNGEDLSDVGKVEVVVQHGGGPDGSAFDPAMLQGGGLAEVRFNARGEVQADIRAERRLVILRDEDHPLAPAPLRPRVRTDLPWDLGGIWDHDYLPQRPFGEYRL